VLPKGLHRVRDYELLSLRAKKLHLIIQLLFLPAGTRLAKAEKEDSTSKSTNAKCPCCQHDMHCTGITRTPSLKGE
jgi:hypothetical protein